MEKMSREDLMMCQGGRFFLALALSIRHLAHMIFSFGGFVR